MALLKCSRLRKPRAFVLMVWILELSPSVSPRLSSALFVSPLV
jgi:hypothetical protein